MKWVRQNWFIIAILVLSLFVRTYRIESTMTFLEDEGRDLLIAHRMIDTGRPVLLGPQTSTGNMYLGPLYYYFITPALFLSGMDPVGPAILIALTGVLATYLIFFLGKKWFSPATGYTAALMFALLPMSVLVTRASWNPHLVPLVTTIMLFVFDRLISSKVSWRAWLVYGALVGVMVQLHYMALIFCGALSLVIAFHYRQRLASLFRGVVLSVVGAVLILSPFILFEARNDWVNTRALTRFLEAKEERNIRYDLPAWLWWDKVSKTSYRVIGNAFSGSSLQSSTNSAILTGYITIFVIALIGAFKYKNRSYLYLAATLLISLATLGIYQENIHLHYIEFVLPLLFLLLASSFTIYQSRLWRGLVLILITVALGLGSRSTYNYLVSDSNFQVEKARAVAAYIVDRAGGEPYNVVSTQGMYTTPFQYFLAVSDNPPSNDLTSRVFDICAGEPCPIDDETTTLLFLTGPAHPSIANYLGHPELNSFDGERTMVSNEHVSIGLWVAEIVLK